MEYDNDRQVKHPHKIEILFWVLLFLMYPLINATGFFWGDWKIWGALFPISLLVFPAYLLFSMIVGPGIFLQKRYASSILLSLLFLVVIQVLLFILHTTILKFHLSDYEKAYFTWNIKTVLREALWSVINLAFSLGIYFIKTALDQKEVLSDLEKDSAGFKLKYLRSQLSPHFLFNTL